MRVLALMKYGARAASTRQRLSQYEPYLARTGITVEQHPLFGDDHLRRIASGRRPSLTATAMSYWRRLRALLAARRYDVVWVHCELFPYLPGWLDAMIARAGRPVVLDYDDAIFHQYDDHRSALVRRLLGGRLAPLMRRASLVIAGNHYLAEYAERLGARTVIIPTVVDTDAYVPDTRDSDAAPVVGWIGSPSTWRYVEPYLPVLIADAPAPLRAVGAGPAARDVPGVAAIEWTEANEIADIQAMDIGIMPLPDEPWARGKCGYKLIQYMACGLPVIASPVGVNVEIVEHGVTGLLAGTPDEWRAALARLRGDPALRHRMGTAGRERAAERYSLASQAPRLAELLTLLGGAAPLLEHQHRP